MIVTRIEAAKLLDDLLFRNAHTGDTMNAVLDPRTAEAVRIGASCIRGFTALESLANAQRRIDRRKAGSRT